VSAVFSQNRICGGINNMIGSEKRSDQSKKKRNMHNQDLPQPEKQHAHATKKF
jgi:hypothetical protein